MFEYDFIRNKLKKDLGKDYNKKKDLIEEFIYHYDKMTILSSQIDKDLK